MILEKFHNATNEKYDDITQLENNQIYHLMVLISNKKLLFDTLKYLKIDMRLVSIYNINFECIQKAYHILRQLQYVIQSKQFTDELQLINLTSQFYMFIPLIDNIREPVINNVFMVNKLFRIVNKLSGLHSTMQIIKSDSKNYFQSLEYIYYNVQTKIKHLSEDKPMFSIIKTYVENTHGGTHIQSIEYNF